ncbi:large conductance mechanosensitive channel protein MscL [soil metagenome]
MLKGFRDFVFRGNVIDLAIAFVLGGAFAIVVNSFVADILAPLLGLLGLPDLSNLTLTLGQAELRYGAFLMAVLAFLMVALAVYLFVVRPMQRMHDSAEATTRTCPYCASEIPLAATRCPMCTSQLSA